MGNWQSTKINPFEVAHVSVFTCTVVFIRSVKKSEKRICDVQVPSSVGGTAESRWFSLIYCLLENDF